MCYVCRLRVGSPRRTLTDVSSLQRRGARPTLIVASRCPVAAPSQPFVSTRPYPSALAHHEALGTAEIQQRHHAYADMTTPRYT